VRDGERRLLLCVETQLELRPGFSGFDPEKADRLIHRATDLMRRSESPIDTMRIVPSRHYASKHLTLGSLFTGCPMIGEIPGSARGKH
jgi:hypothetical protein